MNRSKMLTRRTVCLSLPARAAPLAAALAAPLVAPLAAARAVAAPEPFADALAMARSFDQLHCLTVAHRGETVVEEVQRGPGAGTPVNVKSVSKTLVASLLGAALDRGEVAQVTARLGDVAPRLIPGSADPRVRDITLEHLVTLRAGLERTSGANYGEWVSSPNWIADALARPFVAEPGGPMLYSTGSTHVLGAALAEATGESLLSQARNRLGAPLGIEIPAWTRDPQGYYLGGNQMALSPRAMLRFGEMWRAGGRSGQTQVLSGNWVSASLVPRTRSRWSGLGYGYGWFLGQSPGGSLAIARGYGGQIIAFAPEAEMTIAVTSDPTRPARSGGYFSDLRRLIDALVIAARRA
ncbi:MAG: serine hydrolase [Pseudomonadota bacterium]